MVYNVGVMFESFPGPRKKPGIPRLFTGRDKIVGMLIPEVGCKYSSVCVWGGVAPLYPITKGTITSVSGFKQHSVAIVSTGNVIV